MKKIAVIDKIGNIFEPYDRQYILGQVAGYCHRNPSILRNASLTLVWSQSYAHGTWENHRMWVTCVSFEIDELTEAKWMFLLDGIGSWAVELRVLPDDQETIIMYPSEFKK